MGFCFYCLRGVGRDAYGYSNECFGWDEARACSGITGPDDPVRRRRERECDAARKKKLSAEAKELRAKARALEQEARQYRARSR